MLDGALGFWFALLSGFQDHDNGGTRMERL